MSVQRINNPILVPITTFAHTGETYGDATFHTVKLRISASATGADGGVNIIMSAPTIGGERVTFDISSALRAAADSIQFQPTDLTQHTVLYSLTYWEEYLSKGEQQKTSESSPVSGSSAAGTAYLGGYTEYERITNKQPAGFTRKPLTSIETVAVGDTFLAPVPEASASVVITEPGPQTVQGHSLYAVPANRNRFQFRFINGLGAMESVSVECYPTEEVTYNTEQFSVTRSELLGGISHTRIAKDLDIEQWKFHTAPLTREWRTWYAHEFFMSEHVWLNIGDSWLPVLIIPDETVTLIDRAANDLPSLQFTVKMNFNGSPT